MKRGFLPIVAGVVALGAYPAFSAFDSSLWTDRMGSPNAAVRKGALDDLRALGKTERTQAALILGSVLHRGPVQAERAAQGLAVLGSDAEPALQDLIYALSYDEESVSVAVSSAIVPIGGRAVARLAHEIDDQNFFIRRRIVTILGHLGSAAAPAVRVLAERLRDPQYEVQVAAEQALVEVGGAAIPELLKIYPESDETLRRRIVQLLSGYGSAAVPALIKIAQEDSSGYLKLNSMEALEHMQPLPKEAMAVFIHALSDMDEGVRGGAADALSTLGVRARPALGALKRMADSDPDSLVRQKAADALAVISSTETFRK